MKSAKLKQAEMKVGRNRSSPPEKKIIQKTQEQKDEKKKIFYSSLNKLPQEETRRNDFHLGSLLFFQLMSLCLLVERKGR